MPENALGQPQPSLHAQYDWTTGYRTMQMIGGSSAPYLACTPCVAIAATSYRECRDLRARNAKKVSKRLSRACRPGVPKKCRKSQKSAEKVSLRHFFGTFLTFSALFRHSGPTGPRRPFWDFFGISGPEVPALPVTGRYNRNPCVPLFCTSFKIRDAPDTFNFLRHVMRAILSVRPKCSHRCVSLKETPLKRVQILKHTTKNSTEQTAMRTKWFKHIAI